MEVCTSNKVREFLIKKFSFGEKNKYEDVLDSYYLKKYHLDRLAHAAEEILPHVKPNSKLLDIGSDGIFPFVAKNFVEGIETHAISKYFDRIVFTEDGRAYSLFTGLKTFLKKGSRINIKFCNVEKRRLPFEDNSIDVITCLEMLEHLESDPMHMMSEVNRVLKKDGGLFFLSTPNINSLKALKKVLNNENPYFWPVYSKTERKIGHVKEYSVNDLKLLFEKGGFSILSTHTFNHKEDENFNHDKLYQAGPVLGAENASNDPDFNSKLSNFLESVNWDKNLQGDYILIMSQWKQPVNERYYFPLYESY
jgi:ubiquinone/menaquinone biosynthesis C-methylase UbiE